MSSDKTNSAIEFLNVIIIFSLPPKTTFSADKYKRQLLEKRF